MSFANRMAEQAFTYKKMKNKKIKDAEEDSIMTSVADSIEKVTSPEYTETSNIRSADNDRVQKLTTQKMIHAKKPIYARENSTQSEDDSIQQIDDAEMLQLDPQINLDFKLGPVEKPDYLIKQQQQQEAEAAEKKSEGSEGPKESPQKSPEPAEEIIPIQYACDFKQEMTKFYAKHAPFKNITKVPDPKEIVNDPYSNLPPKLKTLYEKDQKIYEVDQRQ